jgi:hypothetical protein
MRHRHRSLAAALAAALGATVLLSGCLGSGSGSSSPQTGHTRHHVPTSPPTSAQTSSAPTSVPTSTPTSSAPTTPAQAALHFSPKSDGRHSHACYIDTGNTTADYVDYPVIVKANSLVDLDDITIVHTAGVSVAGAWVAPAPADAGTGLVDGWPPPSILTQSNTVQWSKRVTAAGAVLDPGASYNVFLHLVVDPDQLPVKTTGLVFTYHGEAGASSVTWVDHISFKLSC